MELSFTYVESNGFFSIFDFSGDKGSTLSNVKNVQKFFSNAGIIKFNSKDYYLHISSDIVRKTINCEKISKT